MAYKNREGMLAKTERAVIYLALKANNWNRTYAARDLGVSIRTLRTKVHELRSHGLEVGVARHGGARNKPAKEPEPTA